MKIVGPASNNKALHKEVLCLEIIRILYLKSNSLMICKLLGNYKL